MCARSMCHMNITLSVNGQVVAEARRIAALRGTSLNQLVRDYLHRLTQRDNSEQTLVELRALWDEENFFSTGPWTRDELHDRA